MQPEKKRSKILITIVIVILISVFVGLVVTRTPQISETIAPKSSTEREAALQAGKVAATQFYKSVFESLSPCDDSSRITAEAIEQFRAGHGSVKAGDLAATEQFARCQASKIAVSKIPISDALPIRAHDAARKAKDLCSAAALEKQESGQKLQEVFDGGMHPSSVDEMRRQVGSARAGTLACLAGVKDVARKAGIDVERLPEIQ